jgi:lipopolysaccharide biosynthesis glycosyltransferase
MTVPDGDPITIVCAADNNYAMQLTVVLRSVLEHISKDRTLHLYVIDGGIQERNQRKILRSLKLKIGDIEWIQPLGAKLEKMKISGHISIATYFRLLIPDLLPASCHKVIYLDSDLIVTQDIGKLWDIDMQDNYLLAVQDAGIPYVSSPYGLMNYKELSIPSNSKYFNAGVLVMNLKKWRDENVATKVIDYLDKNRNFLRFWDQDGLNAVLAGAWDSLDPRWNQTPAIYEYSAWDESPFSEEIYNNLVRDPYIIHFAKAGKPWNSREEHPSNSLFFQYVDMTEWKGWRLTIWRRFWKRMSREIKQVTAK